MQADIPRFLNRRRFKRDASRPHRRGRLCLNPSQAHALGSPVFLRTDDRRDRRLRRRHKLQPRVCRSRDSQLDLAKQQVAQPHPALPEPTRSVPVRSRSDPDYFPRPTHRLSLPLDQVPLQSQRHDHRLRRLRLPLRRLLRRGRRPTRRTMLLGQEHCTHLKLPVVAMCIAGLHIQYSIRQTN
jgi:hypothetical protein